MQVTAVTFFKYEFKLSTQFGAQFISYDKILLLLFIAGNGEPKIQLVLGDKTMVSIEADSKLLHRILSGYIDAATASVTIHRPTAIRMLRVLRVDLVQFVVIPRNSVLYYRCEAGKLGSLNRSATIVLEGGLGIDFQINDVSELDRLACTGAFEFERTEPPCEGIGEVCEQIEPEPATEPERKSSLVAFAKDELSLIGGEEDPIQRLINDNILSLVHVFAGQDHSGFSGGYAISLLTRLLRYKPLTPLTGEDDEWHVCYMCEPDKIMYQNRRFSEVFKNGKDGKAYWSCGKVFSDDGGETWFSNSDSRVPIKSFPWDVPDHPERVILK